MWEDMRETLKKMVSVLEMEIPDIRMFSNEECAAVGKDDLISKFICLQEAAVREIVNTHNALSKALGEMAITQTKICEDVVRAAGLGDVLDKADDARKGKNEIGR
jgi:hypothetical protein